MIRPARASDAARIVDLLKQSHHGAGFDGSRDLTGFVVPFESDYARRMFARYLRGPRTVCLVHDVDGIARGILLAHAFEHDFGPVWFSQERTWWIEPGYRGSAAFRMLDAYEAWAAAQGVRFAGMAGMGDDPAVMTLLRRRGYRAAETHCLKRLEVA